MKKKRDEITLERVVELLEQILDCVQPAHRESARRTWWEFKRRELVDHYPNFAKMAPRNQRKNLLKQDGVRSGPGYSLLVRSDVVEKLGLATTDCNDRGRNRTLEVATVSYRPAAKSAKARTRQKSVKRKKRTQD